MSPSWPDFDIWTIIRDNAELLDSTIIYDRDYGFDYFGFKTLEKSYLVRKWTARLSERPSSTCICGWPSAFTGRTSTVRSGLIT